MKIILVQGAFLLVPTLLSEVVKKMRVALNKTFAAQCYKVGHLPRQYGELPMKELIDARLHQLVPGCTNPPTSLLQWYHLHYLPLQVELPITEYEGVIRGANLVPLEASIAPDLASKQPVRLYASCLNYEKSLAPLLQVFATPFIDGELRLAEPSTTGASGRDLADLSRLQTILAQRQALAMHYKQSTRNRQHGGSLSHAFRAFCNL